MLLKTRINTRFNKTLEKNVKNVFSKEREG